MNDLGLVRLESGLCISEDLREMGVPSVALSLGNDLETRGKEFRCAFPDDHARVPKGNEDFVKYEVNV